MLVNLKIPDETYEVYGKRNPESPRVELERSLQAFATLDPREVGLILNRAELGEVSKVLGFPISTVKDLLEHLQRSERVSLGEGVEVTLNPGQRTRLQQMAGFYDQTFVDYAKAQVQRAVAQVVGP